MDLILITQEQNWLLSCAWQSLVKMQRATNWLYAVTANVRIRQNAENVQPDQTT